MSKPLELKAFRWVGPLLGGRYLPPDIRPYVKVYQAEVEDGHLTVIAGKEPCGPEGRAPDRFGGIVEPGETP